MALSIVADAGSATANSFVTEAQAIAFAATRLNLSGWVTVAGTTGTATEQQALVEATRYLSALGYQGTRSSDTQALAWPRMNAPNPDASFCAEFDPGVIPQRVQDATCELAIAFLAAGTSDLAALDPKDGVILKTIDVITTQWANPTQRVQGLDRFPRVTRLIKPLLSMASGQVRLVR